jgi:hypothetical protein
MANMISIFNCCSTFLIHRLPWVGDWVLLNKKKSMFNTLVTRGAEVPTTDVDVKAALSP